MKKMNLMLLLLIIIGSVTAQTPQSFKYQAVARDTDGAAIVNTTIGIEISIISNNINGNVVYSETFGESSNGVGIFNLNIGQGSVISGNFSDINWGADSYFLKVAMDVTGGSNYVDMGTTQLLSVPYSLYTASIYVNYSNDTLYIGNQYVVLSGSGPPPNTVTDYDGNVYDIIEIGTQFWLKQNLRSLHYADGSTINGVYAYEDDESYVSDYGRLYTWNALMGIGKSTSVKAQGACPDGWHVPSKAEGETLQDFLGGHMVAGGKLKETGYTFWDEPNSGATNESEFSARGAGLRSYSGDYNNLKIGYYMWTSTENGTQANNLGLYNNTDNSAFQSHPKTIGYSVRCIKD